MHQVRKKKKKKKLGPQLVPAGGCAETRTENRQQNGKIRLTTVATALSSDNWGCCPGIACHEPLVQKT